MDTQDKQTIAVAFYVQHFTIISLQIITSHSIPTNRVVMFSKLDFTKMYNRTMNVTPLSHVRPHLNKWSISLCIW